MAWFTTCATDVALPGTAGHAADKDIWNGPVPPAPHVKVPSISSCDDSKTETCNPVSCCCHHRGAELWNSKEELLWGLPVQLVLLPHNQVERRELLPGLFWASQVGRKLQVTASGLLSLQTSPAVWVWLKAACQRDSGWKANDGIWRDI